MARKPVLTLEQHEVDQLVADGKIEELPEIEDRTDEGGGLETQTEEKPKKQRAAKEAAPETEFSLADPVERLGKLIIDQYFPDLKGIRVAYLFQSTVATSNGEPVVIATKKKAGLDAWGWLNFTSGDAGPGDAFFVIAVSESHWNLMDQKAREGLLMDTWRGAESTRTRIP